MLKSLSYQHPCICFTSYITTFCMNRFKIEREQPNWLFVKRMPDRHLPGAQSPAEKSFCFAPDSTVNYSTDKISGIHYNLQKAPTFSSPVQPAALNVLLCFYQLCAEKHPGSSSRAESSFLKRSSRRTRNAGLSSLQMKFAIMLWYGP